MIRGKLAESSTATLQEPEQAVDTAVCAMGSSSKRGTENDEDGRADESKLTTQPVANESDKDLSENRAN